MIVNGFPRGAKIYTDQVSGLTASAVANTPGSMIISWANPTSKKFVSVMIRYKVGSYPTSPTDGTQAYSGNATSTTVTGLTGGTTNYFRAFAKATNTSGSKVYYNVATAGAQATRATISSPVTGLKVSAFSNDDTHLYLTWTAPVGLYTSIMIRYKAGSYPTSPTDGTLYYSGTGTSGSGTVGSLVGGTFYYFRVFVYNSENVVNNNTSQQDNEYTISSPVTNLSVAKTSTSSLTVSWTLPAGAYSGVRIVYKAGSYPTSATDGILWYYGGATSTVITGLSPGTIYYVRAFVISAEGSYNTNASQQAYNNTKAAAGQAVITSSQTWTVPVSVTSIDIFAVGGGGGARANYYQGGGGGGYTATRKAYVVTPGQQFAAVIGAGTAGEDGGITSFGGTILTANGGLASKLYGSNPGNGGSGGGAATSDITDAWGGDGGSDGSNGGTGKSNWAGGIGQGTTTRAFGDAAGTLYAGGGGGKGFIHTYRASGGAGGGGYGGSPASSYSSTSGTPNTGGGGGGGGPSYDTSGGSGVIIIRWAEQ